MDWLIRVFRGPRALRRWSVATLVVNVLIVVTGGLVRLTGSGLGCPTWPKCTDASYVPHPALGVHGLIEFGNRLLTFALIIVALSTLVSAVLSRRSAARGTLPMAIALFLGIPAQGVIGGITVLTKLNPYVVSLHFLASLVLIALAVRLLRLSWPARVWPAGRPAVLATRLTYVATWLVMLLGTTVTGSGPHAGDSEAVRNGWSGVVISSLHAVAAYATITGALVCLALLRRRAAFLLFGTQLIQAAIGLVQYNIGLPIQLVALHMLGAALTMAAATNLLLSVRSSTPAPALEGELSEQTAPVR